MQELKLLYDYFREHRSSTAVVIAAAVFGGIMGVIAFYNGWLG